MKLGYSVGIATKFIFMVTLLIISAIGVVMFITTDLFKEESVTRVQETNKDVAENLSERVLALFQESREKMSLMAQFALKAQTDPEAVKAIKDILKGSEDLISFSAFRFNEKGEAVHELTEINPVALTEFNLRPEIFQDPTVRYILPLHKKRIFDDVLVTNTSPLFKVPLLSISFLSEYEGPKNVELWSPSWLSGRYFFRAEFREDALMRLFSKKSFITAFMVDWQGRLMAHSDNTRLKEIIQGVSVSNSAIVAKMIEEKKLNNHQMEYFDDYGEAYLGAYKKIGVSGIGVIAEVKQSDALATIKKVLYRSGLVMVTVVCFAFILNFLFSKSLTAPLQDLFNATQKIVQGQYDVHLNVNSSDEIGALSEAFSNMVDGLKEKEKLKGAFNKFHSKEIAKKLLSGEIKLGGEKRQATVFFSDIRGFTAISERMSPDQVMLMLNEYMSEMVNIIYKWSGVVDKYMGDAIMAVWGVPETTPKDAYNAVRAALEMRDFLKTWNHERLTKGKVEIKIGIGLSSGELLAGNIGSEHRLEYTVIGDTVNLASRIESACKPLKSDLLISHATLTLIESMGIVAGPSLKIHAKGKTDELVLHQVIGYKDEQGFMHTSLSRDEIDAINNQSSEVEIAEESKTKIAGSTVKTKAADRDDGDPDDRARPAASHSEKYYFVVPHVTSRQADGPFSVAELAMKMAQRQIDYSTAYVYEEGSDQMLPLSQLMGVDRRTSPPPIQVQTPPPPLQQVAELDEWYVYGPSGETLGPYGLIELELALSRGNLTRTTYVWKKGLANWIYLYQIPEFDRRSDPLGTRKIA